MSVRPRRRGERDEEGATRAAILLFLADNGEQSFTEIRLYIRDQCNVRSPKNLRIHLAGLVKACLVTRESHGPGKADTYRLDKSYRGIKALFGFFKRLQRENEIMLSPHFREYISSQDFQQKVILSIIRTCILRAGVKVMSPYREEWLAMQTGYMPDELGGPVREWVHAVRDSDETNVFKRNFSDLLARYRTDDIDAIHSMFFRLLDEYRQLNSLYASRDYMIMVNEFILPAQYREKAFAMLRLSPAACDYVLNRMADNPLFPTPKLMGQVVEFLVLFPEVYDFTINEGGNTVYLDAIDKKLRQGFMERVFTFSGEPSTYMMMKAMFIHDMVYGRLTCGSEVPEEIAGLWAR